MNIGQLMPCSNKYNLHLKKKDIQVAANPRKKYFQVQKTKYDKLSLQVQCPGQSDLQLTICKLLILLTESCIFIFVSFIGVVVNL